MRARRRRGRANGPRGVDERGVGLEFHIDLGQTLLRSRSPPVDLVVGIVEKAFLEPERFATESRSCLTCVSRPASLPSFIVADDGDDDQRWPRAPLIRYPAGADSQSSICAPMARNVSALNCLRGE